MNDAIINASSNYRSSQLKSVLREISSSPDRENNETVRPILSIVTIYDDDNERNWMESYLMNLPVCETGEIEVILCKTFKGSSDRAFTLQENTVRNGMKITYCATCYDEWSFADVRNAAKTVARGDWILSLDTDEYIVQNQIGDLLNQISNASETIGAVMVTILSHHFEYRDNPISAFRAIRLFRNCANIYWQCRVHETIDFSLLQTGHQVGDSTITVFHEGYDIPQEGLRNKLERNLELLMLDFNRNTTDKIKHYITEYVKRTVRHLDKL